MRAPTVEGRALSFTGVPLAIGGGGAGVAAELYRQLLADQVRGSDGVMRDLDCRVLPQPAPDGTVRVGSGGVVILNRSLGGEREAFYDYNDEDIDVPIRPTGSSGGRSDLIIVRVEDPYSAGTRWQTPANTEVGPYIFVRVIENVSKTVARVQQIAQYAGDSAVTLARVDQPANNTAITAAMIKDFRGIANGPQRYQEPDPPPDPPPPVIDENPWTESHPQLVSHTLGYLDRTFQNWPSSANWRVPIPKWANGVDILCIVENPQQWDHHVWGETRVGMGNHWGSPMPFDADAIPVPNNWPRCATSPWFSGISTRPNRIPIFYSTTLAFTGQFRSYPGTIQTLRHQARMYNDNNTRGRLVADVGTVIFAQCNFKVRPEIN